MATATKTPMPVFTGRYAQIRKDFYKGLVLAKYDPEFSEQKTEAGFRRAQVKKFEKDMAEIDKIERAGTLLDATVTITWSKGGMYGRQGKATIRYSYMAPNGNIYGNTITGDSTRGTGYDKTSQAWANATNKCPEFIKLLMDARVKKKNPGYGISLAAGKPWMPYFDGGVGMGSFNRAMSAMGYKVEEINTYPSDVDIYKYTIKRKPAVRRS